MRSELTPTQQAEHLAKRKEIWGARNSGANRPETPGRPQGFAGATAEATGVDKRNVNKAVARAEKVPEDIRDEIRGTDLDKGVVLDDIARTPPEKQRDKLHEWKSGRQSTFDALDPYGLGTISRTNSWFQFQHHQKRLAVALLR